MFHVIGVEHLAQSIFPKHNYVSPSAMMLAQSVQSGILQFHPTLIAEELHVDWLRKRVSLAQALAHGAGVPHAFCDAGKAERRRLQYRGLACLKRLVRRNCPALSAREQKARAFAIEIAREFPKREEYWIEVLKRHDVSSTIFICGEAHVDGFIERLRASGFEAQVFQRGVGVRPSDYQVIADAKAMLTVEPQMDV
jgi:hypothetical protein